MVWDSRMVAGPRYVLTQNRSILDISKFVNQSGLQKWNGLGYKNSKKRYPQKGANVMEHTPRLTSICGAVSNTTKA